MKFPNTFLQPDTPDLTKTFLELRYLWCTLQLGLIQQIMFINHVLVQNGAGIGKDYLSSRTISIPCYGINFINFSFNNSLTCSLLCSQKQTKKGAINQWLVQDRIKQTLYINPDLVSSEDIAQLRAACGRISKIALYIHKTARKLGKQ